MARSMANFTLDPKVKKAWIKDLRSGKYKQGKGYLYDPNNKSYCCLGRLCSILGKSKLDWKRMPYDVGINVEDAEKGVIQWSVRYGKKHELIPLSELNDEYNLPFAKIADLIEKRVDTH